MNEMINEPSSVQYHEGLRVITYSRNPDGYFYYENNDKLTYKELISRLEARREGHGIYIYLDPKLLGT